MVVVLIEKMVVCMNGKRESTRVDSSDMTMFFSSDYSEVGKMAA